MDSTGDQEDGSRKYLRRIQKQQNKQRKNRKGRGSSNNEGMLLRTSE